VFSIAFRVSEKLHKALFGKFLGALFDRLSCLIKRLQEALMKIPAKRGERLLKSAARKAAEKAYWSTAGIVIAGQAAYNAAEIATARKAFF
jgi:hypothetical protein